MRHVLVIAVLSLLALPIASAGPAHAPSEVVYPLQSLPIKFSHARHLQLKLRCDFCHDKAPTSVSSADDLMPREEACATCHRIDRTQPLKEAKPAARCDSCHVYDPQVKEGDVDIAHPPRVVVPAPNLRFNHKAHEARRIACDVEATDR